MDSNNLNRNEKQKINTAHQNTQMTPKKDAGFFQLTKQQLSVDINRYDSAAAAKTTSLFNTKPIDPEKLQERPTIFKKRLNSLDSTMLEETAYNVLDDTELKLEKRIENIENNLKSVNEKIIVAETIKDSAALDELNLQKKILQRNLESVQIEYQSKNIDTKLTSVIVKVLEFPQKFKQEMQKQFRSLFRRSKLIRKFTPLVRSMMVRDTLGKLDKINKSVDELVKMQVPFGEQEARYETLVNHLSRAGALHSQILRELKG